MGKLSATSLGILLVLVMYDLFAGFCKRAAQIPQSESLVTDEEKEQRSVFRDTQALHECPHSSGAGRLPRLRHGLADWFDDTVVSVLARHLLTDAETIYYLDL